MPHDMAHYGVQDRPLSCDHLEAASRDLWHALECDSSMLRIDFLWRAAETLDAAGFPRWAAVVAAAAQRIGGSGRDVRDLLFDVEREISLRRRA